MPLRVRRSRASCDEIGYFVFAVKLFSGFSYQLLQVPVPTHAQCVSDAVDVVEPGGDQRNLQYSAIIKSHGSQARVIFRRTLGCVLCHLHNDTTRRPLNLYNFLTTHLLIRPERCAVRWGFKRPPDDHKKHVEHKQYNGQVVK
jgi:hypothetical protein